jgi:leucine dehydrogenase
MIGLDLLQADGHEAVHLYQDHAVGLTLVVAIHSTRLGPAIGGCRMWPYPDLSGALTDALRLSRGMSQKAAFAGLACGGGKSVILGDPRIAKTPALLAAVGERIEALGGRYTISDDVGIGVHDVAEIARRTRHACAPIMPDGEAAPATAWGVFHGIRAALAHAFGEGSVRGRRIGVQGLGAVGARLCQYLAEAGAELVVADTDPGRVHAVVERWGASATTPDAIASAAVDVFAPCALGGILDAATIRALRCRVVAGAANNQLATPDAAEALRARGITYAPDFAINVGGLVDLVHARRGNYRLSEVLDDCASIYDRTLALLGEARERDETPNATAQRIVAARLA